MNTTKEVTFSLKAATKDDVDFIYQLRFKTMRPYFEPVFGWDEQDQLQHAAAHLEKTFVVMHNSTKIGVVKVVEETDVLLLDQIQIMPEYQKRGLGSTILKW